MLSTLRFGIEIETVGIGRDQLADAIIKAVGGTKRMDGRDVKVIDGKGRTWNVVPDGSLSGQQNGEIVSPILTYQDIADLQEVVRAARGAGARANETTGIHIHVDGRQFDGRAVANMVKLIHKQERLIEHALGISEFRLGRYCRPIDADFIRRIEQRKPRTLQEVSDAWYGRRNNTPARYDSSRYHGLNLNSLFFRGSIEFRWFQGTTHAGEIKAYVQLVLAIASKALGAKTTSSRRREFNAASARYDFRVFLLGLGMIGDEFRTARLHLTKRLGGSAAWKGERRDRVRTTQPAPAERAA